MKCNFCCDKRITGGVKGLKDHLGGTHRNAGACEKVSSDDVKKECLDYMKCYSSTRQAARRIMGQMTVSGSSSRPEGGGCGGVGGGGGGVSYFSGTRGPMDRFVIPMDRFLSNVDEDEDRYSQSTTWASTDDHRNAVVWTLEDSFTKMEFHSV